MDAPQTRPPILISACLTGLKVRYDGASKPHPQLSELAARSILVPVCPEILGGLGIPRVACWFVVGDGEMVLQGRAAVVDRNGVDRTSAFLKGSEEVLRIVELAQPAMIIFKEGSPSCGVRRVDIEGQRSSGCGVTTAMLAGRGLQIISEEDYWRPFTGE